MGTLITWAEFRLRYEAEWLAGMSYGSRQGWRQAVSHFEELCKPKLLADVGKSMLSKYRGALEAKKLSPASVRSYYAALRAGLGWAESMDLIDSVPTIRHRGRGHAARARRERVPTLEEFERMVKVTPDVRKRDAREFQAFMRGLWHSGLRISELNRMRWDRHADLRVELAGPLPLIVVAKQKNARESYLPAPPEFWALVDRPGVVRRGHVFPIAGRWGDQMTTTAIGRGISDIGKKAGVIVDATKGKCCTAHDLRAAYLTRVTSTAGVTQSQAQTLARHADPKTTAVYYVRHEAEQLARAMGW